MILLSLVILYLVGGWNVNKPANAFRLCVTFLPIMSHFHDIFVRMLTFQK